MTMSDYVISIMTMRGTRQLVKELRASGSESTEVEVKSGLHGFPKSALETMSAFANGTGGTILFGLTDKTFRPVKGFDAQRVHDAVSNAVRSKLTPHPSVELSVEEFEGVRVVRADVEELPYFDKPCFVAAKGAYGGSYIRIGEGDHKLSEYEVSQLRDNRIQPGYDREPVENGNQDILHTQAVDNLLAKARARTPAAFSGVEPRIALKRLNVTHDSARRARPTLAGLLALGVYPQEFYPQLNVTFVAVPGTSLGEVDAGGVAFTDNQSFNGPIPSLINASVDAVRRNSNRAAIISAEGRRDVYDYPDVAVREAMTNALMHRDYSPYARGIQVQMELYSDRLEIRNPGGLYGGVRVEELGRVFTSSSRNAALAKLLEEVEMPRTGASVCENRGSGIARMAYAMQRAGKPAPEFRVTPTSVTVILRLAPAPSVPDTPPRANECVDVSEVNMASDSREEQLIELLARGRDPVTSQRVQDALCLSQSAANRLLRHMIDSGRVLPTAPPRSHRRAYVLASGEVGAAVPGRVVSGRSLP
jgi:ATP-dependent DNA helicase RecG